MISFSISTKEKAILAKHLAVMIRAGLTVTEAIEITHAQAKGGLKKALGKVKEDIFKGKSLANAAEKNPEAFSDLFVSIVRVGEQSGTLDESLEQLAIQLEKEYELRGKIIQALLYPITVLVAVTIVGGGISIFVLPKLRSLFEVFQGTLPAATQVLLTLVDFMAVYGGYVFIALLILFIAGFFAIKTKPIRPLWHSLLFHTPAVGAIIRSINLAEFNRNLGTLLKSGVPLVDSFGIVADSMPNFVYKSALKKTIKEIEKGKSVTASMKKLNKVFPPLVTQMINVGEKSGKLDSVLIFLAEFYESEVDQATKTLSSTLEPILLIVIGLVVGFVMIAIITPIYELTGTIGSV